jgi:aminoglycoside 6'-N-acetyltransferase I
MIRPCTRVDEPGWLEMRQALWPEASRAEHLGEMQEFIDQPQRYGQFIGVDGAGRPTGFIEAAVRHDYVNGTETSPVAFVEGLYVRPEFRRQGWAADLMRAVEAWARDRGCQELASDAALENTPSQATHLALGFEETERVVYFRKVIGDA